MKLNLSSLVLFLLFLVYAQDVISQTATVSGTVSDKADGSSLPGVNIYIQGAGVGTVTDIDGKYSLVVSKGDTLVFYYVGYQIYKVIIQEEYNLDITLKYDCKRCFLDGKEMGLYLKSGVLNTPIGGQLFFSIRNPLLHRLPPFLQSIIGNTISYQTNMADKSFLRLKTGIYHLFVNCYHDFDFTLSYQRVLWNNNVTEILDIESFLNLNPADFIIGYTRLRYFQQNMPHARWKSGMVIGTIIGIRGSLKASVLGKVSLYRGVIGYRTRITRRFRRIAVFLDYYHIDSFNELTIGLGHKFSYHNALKKQKRP